MLTNIYSYNVSCLAAQLIHPMHEPETTRVYESCEGVDSCLIICSSMQKHAGYHV